LIVVVGRGDGDKAVRSSLLSKKDEVGDFRDVGGVKELADEVFSLVIESWPEEDDMSGSLKVVKFGEMLEGSLKFRVG
jgi:hypothetical protein